MRPVNTLESKIDVLRVLNLGVRHIDRLTRCEFAISFDAKRRRRDTLLGIIGLQKLEFLLAW
jgi:hypothetical protein